MTRLATSDRLLLWTLLPLFAVCFAAHVWDVVATGVSQPPVFARPGPPPDRHPEVGGLRLERGRDAQGMQVGDRLVSLGGEDLAGVGYMLFDAIAREKADAEGRVQLVFEREGVRYERSLRMLRFELPWARIPFLLGLVVVGTIVLLRAPERPSSRTFFAAALACAILQSPFSGGPRWIGLAYGTLFNFGGGVALFLLLRLAVLLPDEVRPGRRASRHLAWVGGLHTLTRLNYFLGGPLPSAMVPTAALVTDLVIFGTALGIATWNFANATPIGRRRLAWALLGVYAGSLPMLASVAMRTLGVGPPEVGFSQLFQWSAIAAVAIPLGFLFAILRYNLFDVGRLWTATASLSLLAVVLLAMLVGIVPELASGLARWTGTSEATVRVAFALGLGALVLPAQRRLRGGIDRLFFGRRLAQQRALEALAQELPVLADRDRVLTRLGEGLGDALAPEFTATWAEEGGRFALRVGAPGPVAPPTLAVAGLLRGRGEPLVLEAPAAARLLEALDPAERDALVASEVAVLLPVRSGDRLTAFVALGPLGSGDVYTATELGLLRAVGDRASLGLERGERERALAEERSRADALRSRTDAAEAAQAARSRLLAAASHDLRQPLHALGMYAALLEEQLGSDKAPHTLARLRQTGESLREMFGSLLDLSRLDVGALEPERQVFALDRLLEALAADAGPLAAEKGLTLRMDAAGVRVDSDPVLLGRILRNLVLNAIRYTERGEVCVRCEVGAEQVEIEVADTGPGIPVEHQRAVFEEFVRGEGERGSDGLGLGLTIVERLVRTLGHRLVLESEPGKGARFRVGVPLARDAESQAASGAVGPERRLEDLRVLVIDEELAILESVRELLESWGCRVHVARTVAEAVACADAVDVLLADHRLEAGETGLDAIAAVRAVAGPLPAAIVSAETEPELLRRFRERGLPFLPKPASPARLRAVLQELARAAGGARGGA